MKKSITLTLALLMFCAVVSGRRATRDLKTLDNGSCVPVQGVDSTVNAFMREFGIKGASLAVMHNDSLIYVKGYGHADTTLKIRMEPWHRMRVASVSKLITAIGIMKLQEMGMLSLSDKVFGEDGALRYLVPETHDKRLVDITVEHLLRHQAGFTTERGTGDPMFRVGMIDGEAACREDLALPLLYSPGTDQEYSNVGYYLLGALIRKVTGTDYEKWMQENVFIPMECYDFEIAGNYMYERKNREVLYYMHKEAKPDTDFHGNGVCCESCYGGNNVTGVEGAGGWMAIAPELCRMVAGIDGNDGIEDILSQESIGEMTRFISKESFGIGWVDTNQDGVWTRTGSFGGTTAMIKYFSADGDCWVLITNTSTKFGSGFAKKTSKLIEELRDKYSDNFKKVNLFF